MNEEETQKTIAFLRTGNLNLLEEIIHDPPIPKPPKPPEAKARLSKKGMNHNYFLYCHVCGFKWIFYCDRQSFGSFFKCPNCDSKNIQLFNLGDRNLNAILKKLDKEEERGVVAP